ncbi:glutamate--tRNA ligase [Helicobacter sp. 16-1353]|uniref:glutamate--tRNA ligase n=1 Tax=Helicobacter sp. 16-1353 TaxID=2004996 RepID=UPI000DCC884F|nr:glutamate--tRNA ligase [Helicobacter sp. 16-1353]RAX53871.1 glutamate--tRNA ligase [Helicobacter sp. 16-1353]
MLRFAPSPTGDMHIGNLRVAILNYIIAKQAGEEFLIRIEDTDNARNIEGKDKEILGILNLFGLFWDRLVYQSDNFKQHNIIANELIKKGKAFYCYCTKDFLSQKKDEAIKNGIAFRYDDSWAEICKDINPNPTIRLKGAEDSIIFIDEIKGECKFNKNEIDSFVIIRDDLTPTYNFACSADDMLYDISYIIRGEDHTSNTPKQILVRQYIGYLKDIKYAHLPIILNKDGKKMSKRECESSVKWLLEQGYLPNAILNYLLSMGNKPKNEIFTLKEAILWFDMKNLSKSPVKFDIDQLRYINREHLKRLSPKDMAFLLESNDLSIGALGKIYLEEASTLNEIRDKIDLIFKPKSLDKENAESQAQMQYLRDVILELVKQNDECLGDFNAFKTRLSEICKLNGKALFYPLRFLLTGSHKGPLLNELYPYLRFYLKEILRS